MLWGMSMLLLPMNCASSRASGSWSGQRCRALWRGKAPGRNGVSMVAAYLLALVEDSGATALARRVDAVLWRGPAGPRWGAVGGKRALAGVTEYAPCTFGRELVTPNGLHGGDRDLAASQRRNKARRRTTGAQSRAHNAAAPLADAGVSRRRNS